MAKIFKYVLLGVLVLMSFAAGVAKVMRVPQEVNFFEIAGVSPSLVLPFGLVQLIGAVLAVIPKTRKLGLIVMGVVFLGSVLMIFAGGGFAFGIMSLIPVIIAGVLAFSHWSANIRT